MKKLYSILFFLWFASLVASPLSEGFAADAKSSLSIKSSRQKGQTDRVVAHLVVGGETKFKAEGKPQREKLNVICDLDYLEKTLDAPAGDGETARSIRDYAKASAVVRVGDGEFKPALEPAHRLIAVKASKQGVSLFSPNGNLTRDELDAIDIQANSLLLDRLLPDRPVAIGDRWQHSEDLMAAVLGLDEVAKTTVESTFKEVTDKVARFEITGHVDGAVYGVSTKIEIKGRYRFDLRRKRVDWLGMLIKEDRPASFVADGMDVVSSLQVLITPAKESADLTDAALAKLDMQSLPRQTSLDYRAPSGQWRCQLDRRWHVHHQRPKESAVVLRFLDRGTLTAQCNVSSLLRHEPDKLISLEEFQEDVRKALGKSFGEFVEAGESSNERNYRIYRVVAHGTSSDIAMRWIYYLVADRQGSQAALTFAVEQGLVERFTDADKPLVGSLRFENQEANKKDRKDTKGTKEEKRKN